jgi:hypothetical protein
VAIAFRGSLSFDDTMAMTLVGPEPLFPARIVAQLRSGREGAKKSHKPSLFDRVDANPFAVILNGPNLG